jgi:hypothetical protein
MIAIRLLLATMRSMRRPWSAAQASNARVTPEPSVIVMTGCRARSLARSRLPARTRPGAAIHAKRTSPTHVRRDAAVVGRAGYDREVELAAHDLALEPPAQVDVRLQHELRMFGANACDETRQPRQRAQLADAEAARAGEHRRASRRAADAFLQLEHLRRSGHQPVPGFGKLRA